MLSTSRLTATISSLLYSASRNILRSSLASIQAIWSPLPALRSNLKPLVPNPRILRLLEVCLLFVLQGELARRHMQHLRRVNSFEETEAQTHLPYHPWRQGILLQLMVFNYNFIWFRICSLFPPIVLEHFNPNMAKAPLYYIISFAEYGYIFGI